ncbi:MAG: hypothetical protein P4L59_09345 [Desulfosporosinus sp.]|nr:hypothetical protein [Desulfosporosinus sp.]
MCIAFPADGWQPRISEQRNYPDIPDHIDFIRAYFELHSTLDTITIRKRNKENHLVCEFTETDIFLMS